MSIQTDLLEALEKVYLHERGLIPKAPQPLKNAAEFAVRQKILKECAEDLGGLPLLQPEPDHVYGFDQSIWRYNASKHKFEVMGRFEVDFHEANPEDYLI